MRNENKHDFAELVILQFASSHRILKFLPHGYFSRGACGRTIATRKRSGAVHPNFFVPPEIFCAQKIGFKSILKTKISPP